MIDFLLRVTSYLDVLAFLTTHRLTVFVVQQVQLQVQLKVRPSVSRKEKLLLLLMMIQPMQLHYAKQVENKCIH
jgi:hypothetical protein